MTIPWSPFQSLLGSETRSSYTCTASSNTLDIPTTSAPQKPADLFSRPTGWQVSCMWYQGWNFTSWFYVFLSSMVGNKQCRNLRQQTNWCKLWELFYREFANHKAESYQPGFVKTSFLEKTTHKPCPETTNQVRVSASTLVQARWDTLHQMFGASLRLQHEAPVRCIAIIAKRQNHWNQKTLNPSTFWYWNLIALSQVRRCSPANASLWKAPKGLSTMSASFYEQSETVCFLMMMKCLTSSFSFSACLWPLWLLQFFLNCY